jgi:hypothetical protein
MTASPCAGANPGRARVRRLTHFEYDNVAAVLFNDKTGPSKVLPADTILINGAPNVFGNDSALLSVSPLLVQEWVQVGADIAMRATATPASLASLDPCTQAPAPDDTCTSTVISKLVSHAYHRDATPSDVSGYLSLAKTVAASNGYVSGIAAVIEGILEAPEFLYRIELGKSAPDHPELRKPTADETAARLSFMYWGTIPDDQLRMAAKSGQLDTADGIKAQAKRLVEDDRSKAVVRFFFDYLLELQTVDTLARTASLYPGYDNALRPLFHEEVQQFLQHLIYDTDSPGMIDVNYSCT